jgi:ribosomal protein L12E/L44/L45/RPP1/RPP2
MCFEKMVIFSSMRVTKAQLQQLIREEYVKTMLESKGYKPSDKQVRTLVENLDEGFFDAVGKAFKSGKEAYKAARGEDQEQKNSQAEAKTQDQIKKEIVGIRMKAKDKLKSNGYAGDDGDISVLAVDLFNAAVKEVVSETESAPKRLSPYRSHEKNVRAGGGIAG